MVLIKVTALDVKVIARIVTQSNKYVSEIELFQMNENERFLYQNKYSAGPFTCQYHKQSSLIDSLAIVVRANCILLFLLNQHSFNFRTL